MFKNIRCSNDLYMLKHLEINSQLDTITCIPCFKFKKQPSKHLLSTIKSSFDIFEYVEQDPHQIQSQGLKSLTRNLKLHYENRLHMWCVKEDEPVKQELHDFIKKIEKLGSILLRVYETILRNWKPLYVLQEKDNANMALYHGDISTRTRQKLDAQQKPGDKNVDSVAWGQIKSFDFVCTLIGLYDIYSILVEALLSVQQPSILSILEFDLDKSVHSIAADDFDADEDKRGGDYDLEDPTKHIRQTLIELCRHLSQSIAKRFEDIPEIFVLMKNCLDAAFLYQQVVLDKTQTIVDYGKNELQKLIDFTVSNSMKLINAPVIQDQYLEWKQRCLNEIQDTDTFSVWTTNGKTLTSKVMKIFYTNTALSEGINDFLH
ncbi:unnamed protein product [Rotaria sp. Silwood2]|nr:unnamed protein product [Rotaria sp. Silwood2]